MSKYNGWDWIFVATGVPEGWEMKEEIPAETLGLEILIDYDGDQWIGIPGSGKYLMFDVSDDEHRVVESERNILRVWGIKSRHFV